MALLGAWVAWSLRNRAVVLLGTLFLVLAGLQAARELPFDAVPDITTVQVQIITTAPALSPVEIEQYVTTPVERAMAGLPRSTELRSVSKYGLSVVTIVFEDGTDIYFARQLVSERMGEAAEAVPSQFGRPEMGPISTGLGEIYQFVLRGQGHSLMELEETLDWYIGPQLRLVPGVVELNSFGGENKEYQVVLDPQRLQAANLSVEEVVRALERSNANAGGGYIEHEREQVVIGAHGLVKNLDDLQAVVVGATAEGIPITLANVGEARFGPRLRHGGATMNGEGEVVVGVALMLMGENARAVTAAVKAKLAALAPSLPPGMEIEPFYDRSALVDRTIHTVGRNLLEGAALVILVLFLLLGDLRAGLVVATTIPLAMLFAVVLMRAFGVSGNLMSLGAIDFGLIVDGTVIIVENAVRHLGTRRRALGRPLSPDEQVAVVQEATLEVRAASVFGEIIIAVVYLPILTLRGIEGKLFLPMAATVLFALSGAFVLSLTVVPVLTSYFVRPTLREHETWFMRCLQRPYARALDLVLRRRLIPLGLGALLLLGGLLVAARLGGQFIPTLDEGDLVLEVRRLPGISLRESLAIDTRIERALRPIPEIDKVVSRLGSPELATDPMGIEQSDMFVLLRPRDRWRLGLTRSALERELSAALERAVPEASVALSQPIQMRTNELIAGARSDVVAAVYGPDLERLQSLGDAMVVALKKVPGAIDVRAEQTSGLSYLRIRPDRARLARYGLTVDDVNVLTETMAVGRKAGLVLEGDRRFALVVKLQPLEANLDAVRALPLKAASGQVVPLGDVAEISLGKGPVLVNRDRLSRRRLVEFNVQKADLLGVVTAAQAEVARAITLPPGYRIEWGGQFQHYQSAQRRLLLVVPLALGLILFLLWLALGRLKPALLVFFNLPFAVSGGILALGLRQIPFSISSGVGFIALFGVSVLNGLVLLSFCQKLEAAGKAPAAAIRDAAALRLAPVLMTALVAALGFMPMALSQAPGSEIQRPLATVVIGGLGSATLATLLLFPAVYAWAYRHRG